MLEFFLVAVVLLFFVIAFIGIFVPVIPSLPIAWLGIVIYESFSKSHVFDTKLVVIIGIIALIGFITDLISNVLGAKLFGASTYGIVGSIIGGIIGFFIGNLLGILIGSFLGAFIGEFIKNQIWEKSLKAALGTIVGFLFGSVFKVLLLVVMGIVFIISLF